MTDDRRTREIWAPTELVERRHTEAKAMASKLHSLIDELEKQDVLHGVRLDQHDQRLNAGSAKMGELDAQIRPSARKWIGWFAAAILAVAGAAFTAAKYPTMDDLRSYVDERSPYLRERDRIMRAIDDFETLERDVAKTLEQLKLQQAEIQTSVKTLIKYHESDNSRRRARQR